MRSVTVLFVPACLHSDREELFSSAECGFCLVRACARLGSRRGKMMLCQMQTGARTVRHGAGPPLCGPRCPGALAVRFSGKSEAQERNAARARGDFMSVVVVFYFIYLHKTLTETFCFHIQNPERALRLFIVCFYFIIL